MKFQTKVQRQKFKAKIHKIKTMESYRREDVPEVPSKLQKVYSELELGAPVKKPKTQDKTITRKPNAYQKNLKK